MPTDEERMWAKHVLSHTPGKPQVAKFWDENNEYSVDVLTIPTEQGKVCSTIGLAQVVQWPESKPPIRSEILADSTNEDVPVENIISTAAFYIIKDGWRIKPGAIFEKIVSWYIPDKEIKHLLFINQYQWGKEMSRFELPSGTVFPLLAVPITDPEYDFVKKNGIEALEEIWEKNNVNVCNWARKSAV